jgi:hypothetical protein
MNQDGCVVQINCGTTGPGPVATNMTAVPIVMRQALATLSLSSWLKPDTVQAWMENEYACSEGGVSGQGSEFVMSNTQVGFVYESDRFGGVMRTASPNSFHITASNHNHLYGVQQDDSVNWGLQVGFSSLWRFTVTEETLQSRTRTSQPFSNLEMQQILQRPAHGDTEHSIVFLPQLHKIQIAVADYHDASWDAPYETWHEFDFDQLFLTPGF